MKSYAQSVLKRSNKARVVLVAFVLIFMVSGLYLLINSRAATSCANFNSYGTYHDGNWPAACSRPFADNSPFNTEIPTNPKLATNSTNIVNFLTSLGAPQPATVGEPISGDYQHPYYIATTADPVVTVSLTTNWDGNNVNGRKIRIPKDAQVAGGGDGHITIIQPESDAAISSDVQGFSVGLYDAQAKPSGGWVNGGTITATSGGKSHILTGSGVDAGNTTAASFNNLSGIIRAPEVEAGQINHALFGIVRCTDGAGVLPNPKPTQTAAKCDGTNGYNVVNSGGNSIPLGGRLWLNMTASEIDALPATVPVWKKTILKAIAQYGVIIGDTGGYGAFDGGSKFSFGIQFESGLTYTSFGTTDKVSDWAAKQGFSSKPSYMGLGTITDSTGTNIWTKLKVVDPCVSMGSCATTSSDLWVSPTGLDTNAGTQAAPFKTIQKAVDTISPCKTITVKAGLYKDRNTSITNSAAVTVPAKASGTSSCKTIIKAENNWSTGGKSEIDTEYKARYGFDLSNATNIRVEGFDIHGMTPIPGTNSNPSQVTTNVDSAGVWPGDGAEVVGNNIHDIGGCITVANDKGQNAIFLDANNVVIEKNYIHDIGRSNASGCVAGDQAHDHGVYVNGQTTQTGNTIRNNLFYNNRKGWAVQIYPGTVDNLKLVNNTFAENASANGAKAGNNIITGYGTTITNSQISNNIFYNSSGSTLKTIEMGDVLTVTNVEMKNNVTSGSAMSDNATNYAKFNSKDTSGVDTNKVLKTPLFVNAATQDFHLQPTDTVAKDKGLTIAIVTQDYDGISRPQGGAYDIGAFEAAAGSQTCSTKQGDTNNDNAVNILDISAILSAYGQTNTTSCIDVNKDKSINILDISLVLSKYGT